MKKYINKLLFAAITLVIILLSPNVYAASASVYASPSATVYTNDAASLNVSINAACWNVHVTGSFSYDLVDCDMSGNNVTRGSITIPIDTSHPGTYTVNISGDVTEKDCDESTQVGGSATITVIERPAPQPTQPTNNTNNENATSNSNENNNSTSTNSSTNTDNNTTNNNANESTEKKTEDAKKKETEKKLKPLDVTKFEIVGYDIDFDVNKKTYNLSIDKAVSKLYLIIEGNDISVDNKGIIDINNKDKITLKLKNSDQEVKYTINLNKKDLQTSLSKNKKGNIFIATTILFGWCSIILVIFLVRYIIKNKKLNKESL